MDHGEVFDRRGRHFDSRSRMRLQRECREERERQMPHRFAKIFVFRSVPGVNGIELFDPGDARLFNYSNQIYSSIRDSPYAICESDERRGRSRHPDLGVIRASPFQIRQRKNHIANRAGTDEKPFQATRSMLSHLT